LNEAIRNRCKSLGFGSEFLGNGFDAGYIAYFGCFAEPIGGLFRQFRKQINYISLRADHINA
jgi:hypothetical protein